MKKDNGISFGALVLGGAIGAAATWAVLTKPWQTTTTTTPKPAGTAGIPAAYARTVTVAAPPRPALAAPPPPPPPPAAPVAAPPKVASWGFRPWGGVK